MLVSKLPNGIIDRWNRNAYNIRKRQECEPSLSDLIEFVDKETTLINDPMFSREAIECFSEKSEISNDKRYRRVEWLIIEECDELKKLPVNERSKVFFKKKLCYDYCRLIGDGHNFKTCTKRWNAEIAMEKIQQYCMVCN